MQFESILFIELALDDPFYYVSRVPVQCGLRKEELSRCLDVCVTTGLGC